MKVKVGVRTPSIKKRIAARTSWRRVVRHSMGFKMPRGYGWIRNPKRARYNWAYHRTTISAEDFAKVTVPIIYSLFAAIYKGFASIFRQKPVRTSLLGTMEDLHCPRCSAPMVLRDGKRGKFYGCSRFPQCRGTKDLMATHS